MTLNVELLTQIMALSDEDKYELTQALLKLGTQSTPSATVSQPIVAESPKQTVNEHKDSKQYSDTVIRTKVTHDGKGVEFYAISANGKEKSAYKFMNGVVKLIRAENENISIDWDETLVRTEVYAHTTNVHKHGAHLIFKDGKVMNKTDVKEWVKSHSQFVLTAESKAEYFKKKDERVENKIKSLEKLGYTVSK
jgi:hypothetical protein